MKKKFLTPVIATLALSCATSVFSACEKTGGGNAPQQNAEIHDIYTSYVTNAEENGETPLSYEEWLAVIKGEKGGISDKTDGDNTGATEKSAYEIWLDNGHTGTEQDFLNWLKADGSADTDDKTQIFEFYPLDDGTYSVSVGKATQMNNVSLPAAYKGKPVTAISEKGFDKCENLISITLPDTITSIGNYAFRSCYKLTSITMPDSVTSIGSYAFESCRGLTSITIPNSVTSIGSYAFESCSGLTSITIPNSVTSIGSSAFHWCSKLTNITIPDSVTSIGSYAFEQCSGLTSITIPNSVTSIGSYAFAECSKLTNVTIPNSVTSIGIGAFSNCSSLTNITIPDSVTSIGSYAFFYCRMLTTITIPNSVTSIENSAFSYCDNLTSVYYKGSENEWNQMSIDDNNIPLTDATRYYYSATKPAASGNFWHYNSDGEIETW